MGLPPVHHPCCPFKRQELRSRELRLHPHAATALRQPRCAISVAAQLMQGNEICEGRDFFCAENLRVFFLFA
tara:strand:- start:2995 stop:3210 length:216 start_codon:yes stop_codon:yes gene_type:complete